MSDPVNSNARPQREVISACSSLLISLSPRAPRGDEDPLSFSRGDYFEELKAYRHQPHPRMSGDKPKLRPAFTVWSDVDMVSVSGAKQEVSELTPPLRAYLSGGGDEETRPRCLRLDETFRAQTFKRLKLRVKPSGESSYAQLELGAVKLYVYPLNIMIFTIDVDWTASGQIELTELFEMMEICRHVKTEKKTGWEVEAKRIHSGAEEAPTEPSEDHPQRAEWLERVEEYRSQVGDELFEAFTRRGEGARAVSLSSLVELALAPVFERLELQSARYTQHHTSVLLGSAPREAELSKLLFHLRRGYSEDRYISPSASSLEFNELKRERAFEVRGNRWITIAREGSGSLSWLMTSGEDSRFERETWPTRWGGVYKLLALQAISEQMTLARLEQAAAGVVKTLRLGDAREELSREARESVRELTYLMVRYSLAMSADDCGGVTDYADFFGNVREVMQTPGLRDGLRQDLQEVLA